MNFRAAIITIVALSLTGAAPASRQQVFESYGKLPLSFERNQGQAAPGAAFVARGSGYTLMLLKSGEAVLGLRGRAKDRASLLRMKALGARAAAAEGARNCRAAATISSAAIPPAGAPISPTTRR